MNHSQTCNELLVLIPNICNEIPRLIHNTRNELLGLIPNICNELQGLVPNTCSVCALFCEFRIIVLNLCMYFLSSHCIFNFLL